MFAQGKEEIKPSSLWEQQTFEIRKRLGPRRFVGDLVALGNFKKGNKYIRLARRKTGNKGTVAWNSTSLQ